MYCIITSLTKYSNIQTGETHFIIILLLFNLDWTKTCTYKLSAVLLCLETLGFREVIFYSSNTLWHLSFWGFSWASSLKLLKLSIFSKTSGSRLSNHAAPPPRHPKPREWLYWCSLTFAADPPPKKREPISRLLDYVREFVLLYLWLLVITRLSDWPLGSSLSLLFILSWRALRLLSRAASSSSSSFLAILREDKRRKREWEDKGTHYLFSTFNPSSPFSLSSI